MVQPAIGSHLTYDEVKSLVAAIARTGEPTEGLPSSVWFYARAYHHMYGSSVVYGDLLEVIDATLENFPAVSEDRAAWVFLENILRKVIIRQLRPVVVDTENVDELERLTRDIARTESGTANTPYIVQRLAAMFDDHVSDQLEYLFLNVGDRASNAALNIARNERFRALLECTIAGVKDAERGFYPNIGVLMALIDKKYAMTNNPTGLLNEIKKYGETA